VLGCEERRSLGCFSVTATDLKHEAGLRGRTTTSLQMLGLMAKIGFVRSRRNLSHYQKSSHRSIELLNIPFLIDK
jgi:hypothetical protein